VVANRTDVGRGEGVDRGGGGRDGRDRRWVRRPEADAEDLDAGATDSCSLSDGCGGAAILRVLLSVREQKEHLRPCGPATARLEDGKPGREAAADGSPAVGLLCVGQSREHHVGIGGQGGQDGGRIVELHEPHARRARAEIELKDELARKLEPLRLEGRHTSRVIEDKHQVEGQPVGALGRTRWRRRPRLTRAAVEAVGAVHARRTILGSGATIVAIAIRGERWISSARVRAQARLTRSAVDAVAAVRARTVIGAKAAIVAFAVGGPIIAAGSAVLAVAPEGAFREHDLRARASVVAIAV
jgi:hypothetical protein